MANSDKISLFEEIRAYVKSGMMDKVAEAHNRGDHELVASIMTMMDDLDTEVCEYLQQRYVEGAQSNETTDTA